MITNKTKVLEAITTNKFNLKVLRERLWHSYFMRVIEL